MTAGACACVTCARATADRWQGHRLGSELLCVVVQRARAAGLDSLTATVLSENRAAAALAHAAGFSVIARAGTQTEYELRLRPLADGQAGMGASGSAGKRRPKRSTRPGTLSGSISKA
jgi:GNAT superfamily N-acetyltransferase